MTDTDTSPLDEKRQKQAGTRALIRQWAVEKALVIAQINHTAEVQKILSDAKRISDFYEKGPVE